MIISQFVRERRRRRQACQLRKERRNMMKENMTETIAVMYRRTFEYLLDLIDNLTDEQLAWHPNATTPSIAFHVWHLARWADYLQELVNAPTTQIWEKEGLAMRWGLAKGHLGLGETGNGLDEDSSAMLQLPGKEILLEYARRAFSEASAAVDSIDDERFFHESDDRMGSLGPERTFGHLITSYMTHDNRHLGMIEAMVGMQGLKGSAGG
jgi:uncharacterized damage-inducible protein DinB